MALGNRPIASRPIASDPTSLQPGGDARAFQAGLEAVVIAFLSDAQAYQAGLETVAIAPTADGLAYQAGLEVLAISAPSAVEAYQSGLEVVVLPAPPGPPPGTTTAFVYQFGIEILVIPGGPGPPPSPPPPPSSVGSVGLIPIDPRFMTAPSWTAATTILITFAGPIPRLDHAKEWPRWARLVSSLPAMAAVNAPMPDGFQHWQDWALRFNESLRHISFPNRM